VENNIQLLSKISMSWQHYLARRLTGTMRNTSASKSFIHHIQLHKLVAVIITCIS
jgi:hypothetical protein